MSKTTGQPIEKVREESERDRYFNAKEAVAWGICDEVLGEETGATQAASAADATKPK
jgi:ATP-dependent protease ClpP protease subunit